MHFIFSPVSSNGYWNFKIWVWVALEYYGCCCAFIPSHHYAFKCCISFNTVNSLAVLITCNKLHCLVFVLSSDVFPFGAVWEGAQTLLDLHELCYSPVVTSSPLSLIILDSSLSWTVLFFPLLTAEVLHITNPFHSCLWLSSLLLTYDVKWHANNALQYFKWEYNNFIKKLHSLSVFRFGVYFESRLLNTMKCNDSWIKVTWVSLGHTVCI